MLKNGQVYTYGTLTAMRLLLYIFLLPLLLFGCALLLLATPLPPGLPPPFSDARNLPAALMVGCLGVLLILGLFGLTINRVSRSARLMNDMLLPLGFTSHNYMFFGRQYNGMWQGRSVQIRFVPGRLH